MDTKIIKAISPNEITNDIDESFVIELVNQLLKERFDGENSVIIYQGELIDKIQKIKDVSSNYILKNSNWLNIEPFYEKNGWTVEYKKVKVNNTNSIHKWWAFVFTPKND